jgi:hypothetical protein
VTSGTGPFKSEVEWCRVPLATGQWHSQFTTPAR